MFSHTKSFTVEQYLRIISGQEKEPNFTDHNYVKHYSAHPDSQRTKPAKMLFMNTGQRYKRAYDVDEIIDIENVEAPVPSPFDNQKSKVLVNDLEQSLKCNPNIDFNKPEISEDLVNTFTLHQRKIYEEVMQSINAEILAKKAYSDRPHESIKRKLATENHAQNFRLALNSCFYDFDLVVWVHKVILDNCSFATLAAYLNLLQALRTKAPSFADRIIKAYSGNLGFEYLSQLLKKSCDPALLVLNHTRPKKMPGNPILMISTAGFDFEKALDNSPRFQFWKTHLSSLCKTMYIPLPSDLRISTMDSVEYIIEIAVESMKQKVMEIKNHYPNRPVILGGWNIGALVACHVALDMPVDAVVCLGFPLTGVNGSRGDLDDPLLNISVPTLFIIGQNANMCSTDNIEDFRARMSAETGLVIVGGADDLIRVSPGKMLQENITQSMVDRCILEEINYFLLSSVVKLPSTSTIVSSNPIKSCPTIAEESAEAPVSDHEDNGKRKRRRPKEYSPELPTSRKRARPSIPKEMPRISLKLRLSPPSSEASSSGSFKNEKQIISKPAKKTPEKRRVGRPPSSTSRKRSPVKPIPKLVLKPSLLGIKPVKRTIPEIPPLEEESVAAKPAIPFALNILPKRDELVDVEKAFGNDSSFLPRALTPPEPEDTVSAEETEKVMAELAETPVSSSELSDLTNTGFTHSVPQNIVSEKPFKPLAEQQSTVTVIGPKTISGSIIKPILNPTLDAKKRIAVSVAPSALKTVFQQGNVLSTSSIAHLKNISGVNLIANTLCPTKTVHTTKTMITVPSNTATILVSGSPMKHSGKVLQLLSKGPIALKKKDATLPSSSATSSTSVPAEPQVCNLSLLSDVAGMTEPLKDAPKKIDTSSATLVKLAVPDKSHQIKRFQVVKGLPARPILTRIDTPEEMAEKQLAIQALNKSIGLESSTSSVTHSVREPGYSICYAKPDGSFLSRTVPRPGHATYIRQSIVSQPPGRGGVRPILPNKTYRFYHK